MTFKTTFEPKDALFKNVYDSIYNDFFNTNRIELVSTSKHREEYRVNGIKTVCELLNDKVVKIEIEREV